jgi:hypothetical protein
LVRGIEIQYDFLFNAKEVETHDKEHDKEQSVYHLKPSTAITLIVGYDWKPCSGLIGLKLGTS